MPMKPCSSSCAKASKHQRDEPNCVNGWQLSIHWHMSVGGKGDALVIGENARISSICAAARSSTICMSWLVPKHFRLSFKLSLDYLTDALDSTSAWTRSLAETDASASPVIVHEKAA